MGSPFVVVGGIIENQEDHHRAKSFQDEYPEFLNRYGIEFE